MDKELEVIQLKAEEEFRGMASDGDLERWYQRFYSEYPEASEAAVVVALQDTVEGLRSST